MVMVSAANGAGAAHASSPQTGTVGASGPSAAQLKRLLTSLLAPSGKDATIAALLKHHGYSRSVTMPAAARVSVAWRLLGGKGRNTIVVASLTTRIRGAHRATIKVALTKQGQRLLAQGKRLRLSARGTLTVAGVAPITASKTIVIRPARH